MKRPIPRPTPERPWWRTPFRYLLRVRPRQRHVHGTLIHRLLGERLLAPALWIPSRDAAARGFAIGIFIGLLPLPGQIFFSALLCYAMRSNLAIAALATFISNPLTTPGLVWIEYKFGRWLLPLLRWTSGEEFEGAGRHFAAYGKPILLGSLSLAILAGLVAFPLMHGLWIFGEWMVRRRAARLRARRLRLHQAESRHGD
jgi:uncharacterized protein (DUF2062 family)